MSNDFSGFATVAYTGFVTNLIDKAPKDVVCSQYFNIPTKEFKLYQDENLSNKSYTDNVSGYTLRQIEDALRGTSKANQWIENIKRINNPCKIHIDEVYNFWYNK